MLCQANEDFYQLLGVNSGASESEVKRAFRRKSVEFHPDKNSGDEKAAAMFRKINRAHEVLTDKDKKHVYDQFGEDVLERYERGEKQLQRGPNSKLEVEVTLEELFKGVTKYMTISRDVMCKKCKGTGAKDGKLKKCTKCHGRGVVMQNVNVGIGMTMQMQQHCPKCGGQGVISAKKCEVCHGNKVHAESKTLNIVVEPGMQNEEKIIFERDAQQQPDVIPGDVIVILKQKKHSKFGRIDDDLYYDMKITLEEALLGFSKPIKMLDGRSIEIRSEPNEIVQPFSWKIIEEEGMPVKNNSSVKGKLHVKFIVGIPKKLSSNQREIVQEIFKE
jgi:DnaJ-class molecular chaperone